MEEPTHTCADCELEKPLSAFYIRRDKRRPNAPSNGKPYPACKDCYNARRRGDADLAERQAARYRQMKANEPERYALYLRTRRFKVFGLTLEEGEALIADADGRCQLCLKPCAALVIDHCHETGRVRGVICPKCNNGLGALGDTREALLRALAYLDR